MLPSAAPRTPIACIPHTVPDTVILPVSRTRVAGQRAVLASQGDAVPADGALEMAHRPARGRKRPGPMRNRLGDEVIAISAKRDLQADGEVQVFAKLAGGDVRVARLDRKDERLARVELEAELLDFGQRRDLYIGDDALNW